jgi:hypothetical protein
LAEMLRSQPNPFPLVISFKNNGVMKEKSRSTNNVKKIREHLARDLQELQHDELSGYENKESSLATSSTDEDEGLGDGNMGRNLFFLPLEIYCLDHLFNQQTRSENRRSPHPFAETV